jgi:hypothetical protein
MGQASVQQPLSAQERKTMLKLLKAVRSHKWSALGALGAICVAGSVSWATGLWPGLPQLGGVSYCASWSNTSANSQCGTTVPAGTTAFTGNEALPSDAYGPLTQTSANAFTAAGNGAPPQSQYISVLQLGNGGFTNLASTTSATTVTVPCTTSMMFENATVTNPTITFCATPLQGQKFTLVWGANLTTGITTAAGAGSTCLPACGAIAVTTAGTVHQWLYNGTIWYQIQ